MVLKSVKELPPGHRWKVRILLNRAFHTCIDCYQEFEEIKSKRSGTFFYFRNKIVQCSIKVKNNTRYNLASITKDNNCKEHGLNILKIFSPDHDWEWLSSREAKCKLCNLSAIHNSPTNYKHESAHRWYFLLSRIDDSYENTCFRNKTPSCLEIRMQSALL